MITAKFDTYCSGDMSEVANFQEAFTDNKRVWKLFHRNLLTGVGRITWKTLDAVDKFYNVPPDEVMFLPKSAIRALEKTCPLSDLNAHSLNLVLKFWCRLYPSRPFSELTREQFDELYRSIRRLRVLWGQMKARCHNPSSQDYPHYGKKGIRVCDEWLNDSDAFATWALQNGYRYDPTKVKGDQLSIDRKDATKNYQPSNCQWIPHRENCARTRTPDWSVVIERCYEMAKRFPLASDMCWGRPRVDWKKVRDIYMDGDNGKIVKFLKEHEYTPMAVYRIRKILGDVVSRSSGGADHGHA